MSDADEIRPTAYMVRFRDCDSMVVAAEHGFAAVEHALAAINAENPECDPMTVYELESLSELCEFYGVASRVQR